jgi:hypothetical protein
LISLICVYVSVCLSVGKSGGLISQSQLVTEILDHLASVVSDRRTEVFTTTWVDVYAKSIQIDNPPEDLTIPDAATTTTTASFMDFDDESEDSDGHSQDGLDNSASLAPASSNTYVQATDVLADPTNACPFEQQDFIWWSILRLIVHTSSHFEPYTTKKPENRYLAYLPKGIHCLRLLWTDPNELRSLRHADPDRFRALLTEAANPMFNSKMKMNTL